ncbi:hypothetical protein GCM10009751_14210 [Myceligenerans crystallogenes]|uniref:Uncharacterized protein n=1 Tax=Myceligenerans crystallogenes TaxID=316335 RepID=A0ABP4ZHR5_9MICO
MTAPSGVVASSGVMRSDGAAAAAGDALAGDDGVGVLTVGTFRSDGGSGGVPPRRRVRPGPCHAARETCPWYDAGAYRDAPRPGVAGVTLAPVRNAGDAVRGSRG